MFVCLFVLCDLSFPLVSDIFVRFPESKLYKKSIVGLNASRTIHMYSAGVFAACALDQLLVFLQCETFSFVVSTNKIP